MATILAPENNRQSVAHQDMFRFMRDGSPRGEFLGSDVEPDVLRGTVHVDVRRALEDQRVHVVLLVGRDVVVEIVHELFPLHALAAAVADLRGEVLQHAHERRHGEQRPDPAVVRGPRLVRGYGVLEV